MLSSARRIAILGLLFSLVGCGPSAVGETGLKELGAHAIRAGTRLFTFRDSHGRQRSFVVYAPTVGTGRHPLLLVYHGANQTASGTEIGTDFAPAARQYGLVVAFMQGYANTWNEGAGHTPARVAGVDDVQYTQAVLSRIERSYAIDTSRIAAAGFSNGALMTQLLGCRLATQLTAIVPVEGEIPVSVVSTCHPRDPISVLEIHGTGDTTIPYNGGRFFGAGGGTTVLSAPGTVAHWAALDHCAGSNYLSASTIRLRTYVNCHREAVVRLQTIVDGGHEWPSDVGTVVARFLIGLPKSADRRAS